MNNSLRKRLSSNPRLAAGGCSHGPAKDRSSKLLSGAFFQESSRGGSGADIEAEGKRAMKSAAPRKRGRADGRSVLRGRRKLPRRARIAAICTNAVVSEIVPAPASEALFVRQFDPVRPLGSPAFAAAVLLYDMPDVIVVAVLS
jgi:hypothetical protein